MSTPYTTEQIRDHAHLLTSLAVSRSLDDTEKAGEMLLQLLREQDAVATAERIACARISPNGMDIRASALPHEVWTKYREAILSRGTDSASPSTSPCRCGPDGCADSACPGRKPTETTSAWDKRALDTAQAILAIEGNDREQLAARVQLAVLDAMQWAAPVAPAEQPIGIMSRATYTTSSGAGYKALTLYFEELHDAEQVRLWAQTCGTKARPAAPVAPGEPAATLHDDGYWTTKDTEVGRNLEARLRYAGTRVDVYLAPVAPAFDILAHLARQCEFSARTFGPGPRVEGVTDHIAKELIEVRDSGGALAEWVDVIILAFDGAWRSGAMPQQIIDAMVAKQTKNEGRIWPDWRTAPAGKAIEHDRSGDS